MTWTVVGLIGIAVLVSGSAFLSLRDGTETKKILQSLRWWMLPINVFAAVPILALATITYAVVPFSNVSWWTALGGEGNALLGQTDASSTSQLSSVLTIAILVLLLLGVAAEAATEERLFRGENALRGRARRFLRAVYFGLFHLWIVPIGAVPALVALGLYYDFMYQSGYRQKEQELLRGSAFRSGSASGPGFVSALKAADQAGLDRSTAIHTSWNLMVIIVVFMVLALG